MELSYPGKSAAGNAEQGKKGAGRRLRLLGRLRGRISETGGPRCCKRDSYLAIAEAVKFTQEKLAVRMESHEVVCSRSEQNK